MAIEDSYRYFRITSREIVDRLNGEILKLEKGGPSAESVRGLLRQSHMLSGAARIVKQTEIVDLATRIDDLMAPYRETSCAIPSKHLAQLRSALDAINRQIVKFNLASTATAGRAAESKTISHHSSDFRSYERVRLVSA